MRWELGLLAELGFGLDLRAAPRPARTDDLVYVSPRSGQAVSAEAGAPYRDKLLRAAALSAAPASQARPRRRDVLDGLALTGFFLERRVLRAARARAAGRARSRFVDVLASRFAYYI